jgi:23S rRNA pseudouridine955/2504/2580 synthase
VGPEQAGQRIDNFLLGRLKGVPKSRIYRILRRGEVRVNRGRVAPGYRVREGDAIRIPPLRTATTDAPPQAPGAWLEQLAGRILFEDADLLVFDKPSGLAAHGGSGVSLGAIEALRQLRPAAPLLELVHRLDRDTSGCMLVAKRKRVLRELHALLRERRVDKRYLLLVCGHWEGGARKVEHSLLRNVLRGGERIVSVNAEGQEAVTQFTPRERFAVMTLLEGRPMTGRTHQLRVHAATLGHPIAGDAKYGDDACNRELRRHGLNRLFLHAHEIRFRLDGESADRCYRAPLEPALEALLDELRRAVAV